MMAFAAWALLVWEAALAAHVPTAHVNDDAAMRRAAHAEVMARARSRRLERAARYCVTGT
jgi:hypothetical protein